MQSPVKSMQSPVKSPPKYFAKLQELFDDHYPGQHVESVLRDSFDAVVDLVHQQSRPRVSSKEAKRRLKAFSEFVSTHDDDATDTQGDMSRGDSGPSNGYHGFSSGKGLILPAEEDMENLPDVEDFTIGNIEPAADEPAAAAVEPDTDEPAAAAVEPDTDEPAAAADEPAADEPAAVEPDAEPVDPDDEIVEKCEAEITTSFIQMVEKVEKDLDLYASWHLVSRGLVRALESLMKRHHNLIDEYNDKKKEHDAHSSGVFMSYDEFLSKDQASQQVRNLIETYKLQGDFEGVDQMKTQLDMHLGRLPEKYKNEKEKFEKMKQESMQFLQVDDKYLQPVVPKQQSGGKKRKWTHLSGDQAKAVVKTKKSDEQSMITEHLQKKGDWVPFWTNDKGDHVSFSDYVNHVVAGSRGFLGYGMDNLSLKECDCQTCRVDDPSKNTRGKYFKSALHCPSYNFKSRVVLWTKSGGVYSDSTVPDFNFYASRMQKNGPACKLPKGCELNAPQVKKKNLLHYYEKCLFGDNLTVQEKENRLNPRCHICLFANDSLSVLVLIPLQDINAKAVEEMRQAGFKFKTTIMPVERINKERLGKIVPQEYGRHKNIVMGSKESLFVFDSRNRAIIAERIIMRGHHLCEECMFNGKRMDTLEKLAKMSLGDLERLEEKLQQGGSWRQPEPEPESTEAESSGGESDDDDSA